MMNLCLLLSGQASQELVAQNLQGLVNQMDRVGLVLQSQVSLTTEGKISAIRTATGVEKDRHILAGGRAEILRSCCERWPTGASED
jgi:hypothetical protein